MIEELQLELEFIEKNSKRIDKCIVIDSNTVFLLKDKTIYKLSDYFESVNSKFDPYYAMCYTTPGDVKTLKQIHIHCLECEIKRLIINNYIKGKLTKEDSKWIDKYLPSLIE